MLDESFAAFYGGIDFQNNLTRAEQMNSIMLLDELRVVCVSGGLLRLTERLRTASFWRIEAIFWVIFRSRG